jgi:glycosyltransferase involved in cell wall biosynthesis
MKIFINARFLTQPVSGVQRYAIECSRQILKMYPDAEFLAPANIIHNDIATELNAKIIGSYKSHNWEQIDLPLHLNQLGNPPLLNLANTAPVAYSNSYVTIHDLAFMHSLRWNSALFATWYKWLVPRIAKKAQHIFTVSNTIAAEIQEKLHVPANKISVTYNGVAAHLQSIANNLSKEKIVLSVGSFNLRKNHDKLVKAFLQSDIQNEYTLIILGDKNKVFKNAGLDEHRLTNANIKILEGVTDDELVELYQKAEIVASLSAYEGFGIPILEGLYFGCKAICSDIPAYKELYHNYAYFCGAEDIDGISKLLAEVAAVPPPANNINLLTEKYNYTSAAQTIIKTIAAANTE